MLTLGSKLNHNYSLKASSFCNPSEINNNSNNPFLPQSNYYSNGKQLVIPNANLENAFTINKSSAKKNHNKHYKEDTITSENQYVINFERIISNNDKRTTMMIRNIPNKYNISSLLEEINVCFEGKYDFLYLPLDYKV